MIIMANQPLIKVENLKIGYEDKFGDIVEIVENVSFELHPNETLCIVGESGSGKSVSALAILGLLPPGLRILEGSIWFGGRDLAHLDEAEMRKIRGNDIAMVFQDPMTSLNPVKRVGYQVGRAVIAHEPQANVADVRHRVVRVLEDVGIADAEEQSNAYPHQWSGGMRQRAVIGTGIINSPSLLLADEPTTALDVTVQAKVLETLRASREATGAAMLLITHDLGVVAEVADTVAVMYSGRLVEQGTVWDIFDKPQHPYTQGLLGSLLTASKVGGRAQAIPGSPPPPDERTRGCPFSPRCESPFRSEECESARPVSVHISPTHNAACIAVKPEESNHG